MESGCVKDSLLAIGLSLLARCMKFTRRYLKIVVVGEKVESFKDLQTLAVVDSVRFMQSTLAASSLFLETHVLWFNYYASVVSG